VYTDYEFTVEKVWKDSAALLGSKTSVVVTRPGGSLTLPEGHVNWQSNEFPPLRPETVYLLFLHLVRGSLGYEAMDSFSTLEADKLPGFSREGFEKAISERVAECKPR
ncbi:MAG TPA: hypothetical protein VNH18_29335, partial [Bryobacteraceae bacterium]|nr:hypothetical protein [Bryobacteraceae bacterium]